MRMDVIDGPLYTPAYIYIYYTYIYTLSLKPQLYNLQYIYIPGGIYKYIYIYIYIVIYTYYLHDYICIHNIPSASKPSTLYNILIPSNTLRNYLQISLAINSPLFLPTQNHQAPPRGTGWPHRWHGSHGHVEAPHVAGVWSFTVGLRKGQEIGPRLLHDFLK